MTSLFKYVLILGAWLLSDFCFSQSVQIVYPTTRAVFQRDNSNNGIIPITGYGNSDMTRAEARLVPINTNQGTLTDWVLIDGNPVAGSFSGVIQGKAGWYVLQIRTFNASGQNGAAEVSRIGIGEVFIIAGQSNAQGFNLTGALDYNQNGATEDRVNAYNFYNVANIPDYPELSNFVQLGARTNIGPRGQGAWAWGEFGDRIVRELNVPVLFFNAAYEGTLISDWVKSYKGETIFHSGFGFQFPGNTPYSFLGNLLKTHVQKQGLRAIIWVQGESDSDFNTSESDYYDSLKELIEITRQDARANVNWIVTRTSVVFNQANTNITNAQNRIIRDIENVYAGPDTDILQIPRPDGVHLRNVAFGFAGLSELAAAFWRQLDTFFFNNSTPVSSGLTFFEDLKVSCSESNQVVLAYDGDFEEIAWNRSNFTSTINALSGVYQAFVKDGEGRVRVSKAIDVSKVYPPSVPRVVSVGEPVACEGDVVEFTVQNTSIPLVWHDASTTATYTASREEQVFARYKNEVGCFSNISNVVVPEFVPKPSPPTIISQSGVFAACEGEEVTLTVQNANDFNVIWSDGSIAPELKVNNLGTSSFSATVSTRLGCASEASDAVEVSIVSAGEPPMIVQDGPYTMTVTSEENLANLRWYGEFALITQNTFNFFPPGNGFYRVQADRQFDELGISCTTAISGLYEFKKESEGGLVVYPNPVPEDVFYLSSDQVIDTVILTMIDAAGRVKFRKTINNVSAPVAIQLEKYHYFGRYTLRLDYNGFFRSFPLVFE